jgi:hypothetical protein
MNGWRVRGQETHRITADAGVVRLNPPLMVWGIVEGYTPFAQFVTVVDERTGRRCQLARETVDVCDPDVNTHINDEDVAYEKWQDAL